MKTLTAVMLLFTCLPAIAQKTLNLSLKKQLDSVMILESRRRYLHPLVDPMNKDTTVKGMSPKDRADYVRYWKNQDRIDSMNVVFVDSVFKIYGYPGKTLVGNESAEIAWIIIQHSKNMNQYLSVIEKAAKDKELRFMYYANMIDNDLVVHGKEQMYGTQAICKKLKGATDMACFIWPIKDAAKVNERRKQAGFESTVEENAKVMNIKYKVLTLADVQ